MAGEAFHIRPLVMLTSRPIVGLLLGWLLIVGCACAQGNAGAAAAGVVKRLVGSAVLERDGLLAPVVVGNHVNVGDTLRTGPNSALGIALTDDTLITVGANSEVQLNTYAFDYTTQDGNLLASVWRGTAAFVTGLIARRSPENVRVQTRTVVLGVRGTEFIVDAGRGAP